MHFIPDGTAQPKLALALDSRMAPLPQSSSTQGDATAAVAAYFASEGQRRRNPSATFKPPPRRTPQSRSRSEAFMSMAGSASSQDSYHPPSLDYTSHVDRPRLPFQDNLVYEPAFSVRPQREVVDEPNLSKTEPPSAVEPFIAGPTPMDASKALQADPSHQSMTAAFNYLTTDLNGPRDAVSYMGRPPTAAMSHSLPWSYPMGQPMRQEYVPSYVPEMPTYHPNYHASSREATYTPFGTMPSSGWAMPEPN